MADQDRVDGPVVFGGVDTHRDAHVGAVADTAGRLLGSAQFRADPGGYAQLVAWMESRGRIRGVGVEGTGSYGAGLARHLGEAGIGVMEVNRPNRQLRRRRGKDDHTDAEAAARAALSGEATAVPKSGDGPVEWIRMLTVVRRSAVKNHTQAANQIHSVAVTAPEPLKAQLRGWSCPAFLDTSRFVIHRVVVVSFRSLRVSGIRWLSAAGGGCRSLRCSRRRRIGPGSGWRSWSGPGVRSRGWRRTTRLRRCRRRRLGVPSTPRRRPARSGPGTPP